MTSTEASAITERWRRPLLVAGLVALAVSGAGAFASPEQFFRSYLHAFVWWLGVALGCLPLLMLHHLVGGQWGFVIRRCLEAAARTLPLFALLFVPIAFGMHHLYEWTHEDVVAADPVLLHKSPYLNTGFFLVRAAVYFGVWIGWGWILNRWSAEQDRTGERSLLVRMQVFSAAGILAYALTITFASVDWVMSLEPHWFSTIYGMLFMVGQVLSALALSVLTLTPLRRCRPLVDVLTIRHLHDLGNLMLAFVLLWAYVSFSQYLIIWSGNLPEEIPFYLDRTGAGWQWIALGLIVFHFALPFALLLSRTVKRKLRVVVTISIALLLLRWVDLYWLIAPAFHEQLSLHWLDIVIPIGIGGVWLSLFLGQVASRPLLPLHDPRLGEVSEAQESTA